MMLRLNRAHWPVTVLGPGRRIGLWFQGCSIGCSGCIARDTWDPRRGVTLAVASVVEWCRGVSAGRPDGVTLTGGEPFEQPGPLSALVDGLCAWRARDGLDFDILCYSGWPLAALQAEHAAILMKLDTLIPEPFVHRRPLGKRWRGSDNQPLVPLSERGRARYARYRDMPPPGRGEVQIGVGDDEIWYIGIPQRGDMARIERAAAAAGLALEGASWRS